MRTAERAYCDAAEQRYLFARCMVPYHHVRQHRAWQGRKILDAGCGAGSGSGLLAAAGAHVAAVDASADDVALTVRAASGVGGAVADVYSLPFASGAFDAAVSCHVLEHLHHPERYLQELARVLRPGGLLWLITPNRVFSSPHGPPPNPFHVKEYFAEEFEGLVLRTFSQVAFFGVAHKHEGAVARADDARRSAHRLDPLNVRRFLPTGVKRALRSLAGASYPTELRHVDVEDFAVGPLEPSRSVDLMAVATLP